MNSLNSPNSPTNESTHTTRSRGRAMLVLVLFSAVWGFSFPIIKDATVGYPVSAFLLLRFSTAMVAMLLVSWRALLSRALWARRNHRALLLAFLAGLANFVGFETQTVGLQTTSPGSAAFITALYVVLVPLILVMIRRISCHNRLWASVLLSVVGLACLFGQRASFSVGIGAGWLLLTAVAFALQIVLTGMLPAGVNMLALVSVQLLVCTMGAILFAFADPSPWPALPPDTLTAAIYLGIVATAVGTVAQTWAQRHVAANETALIFCSEPAWGALASVMLASESFTAFGGLGCALMLLGMISVTRKAKSVQVSDSSPTVIRS